MADKNFAFESEEISIAFALTNGLGDCIISKKVFNALIELAPDCFIDIFAKKETLMALAKSFYSDSKNLNRIFNYDTNYAQYIKNYDLALMVGGSHVVILEWANSERLESMAPKLFDSLVKISEYNQVNLYSVGSWSTSVAFRNMMMARILNKNCYEFLSCDGALPIRDDKVNIPLFPEYKSKFDALNLDKYITIYSNIGENERMRPKVKAWSIRYWYEYISRMKKRLPQIEIIQCGGGGVLRLKMPTVISWAVTWNLLNIFWRTVSCMSVARVDLFI